jgi:hypothetical protein
MVGGLGMSDALRPAEDWHEDYGDVLWWHLDEYGAISEAPIVASGLDVIDNEPWCSYYSHWSPLPAMPQYPVREMMLAPMGALLCDGPAA